MKRILLTSVALGIMNMGCGQFPGDTQLHKETKTFAQNLDVMVGGAWETKTVCQDDAGLPVVVQTAWNFCPGHSLWGMTKYTWEEEQVWTVDRGAWWIDDRSQLLRTDYYARALDTYAAATDIARLQPDFVYMPGSDELQMLSGCAMTMQRIADLHVTDADCDR